MIRTRFAPSPTGFLHLGGARTALFNWLFAKKNNGSFYLRIDDTDKKRSKNIYLDDIKKNLSQLGINWDNKEVYQSQNLSSHLIAAAKMLENGTAYYCKCTREEIDDFHKKNPGKKFISPHRKLAIPKQPEAVLRLKIPLEGSIVLRDNILGKVSVQNTQIDDLILVRSDGSPTYILSSAVDDHNMQITNVIRGNDHLTNTFKQLHIIKAMGWGTPEFAHIPLIMNEAGQKLSKRDGNFGLGHYLELGYLPMALNNYLLRLGWSHGNEEIISIEQAVKIFTIKAINKSPAKFDLDKLKYINQIYLKNSDNKFLSSVLSNKLGITDTISQKIIEKALPLIKERGQTINEIIKLGKLYLQAENPLDAKATAALQQNGLEVLKQIAKELELCKVWETDHIKNICHNFAGQNKLKIHLILKPLRAAIFGTFQSPPLFESMEALGKNEVSKRISQRLLRC